MDLEKLGKGVKGRKGEKRGKGGGKGDEGELSLEEISKLRQNAQQKSIDAVRGLEERFQKAKEKDSLSEKTTHQDGGDVGENDTAAGVGGYVKKTAVDAKDRAGMAGLGVAKYTTDKTVAATKATADLVEGMAGYVGEKTAAAKDYVGEKAERAKNAVVGMEENAAEYLARKKAETERNVESEVKEETEEEADESYGGDGGNMVEEIVKKGKETSEEETDEEMMRGQQGGGVLQAIGETLVEIAQTAKHLVIGSSGESENRLGK